MDTIKLNDKEYISKEEVDNAYILKTEVKDRTIGITDPLKIFILFNIEDEWYNGDLIRTPNPKMVFKDNGNIGDCNTDFNQTRITTKVGTKISYDMYIKIKKLLDILDKPYKKDKKGLKLYEGFDETTKTLNKDYPVLLVQCGFGVILAPRVDYD